jgi:hypothetical protein
MTTVYRHYMIAKLGDVYVAQSEDDHCYMISRDLDRVSAAIDEVWTALERGREPAWFSSSTAIDLDHIAIEAEAGPPAAKHPPPSDPP